MNRFKIINITSFKNKLSKKRKVDKLQKLTIIQLNGMKLHLYDTIEIDMFGHVNK